MSAALDMKDILVKLGVPEPKVPEEKTPPIPNFDIPRPKPLQEALLKLKVCKETVNKLNRLYISRTNEYRSETTCELQLLWRRLHEEGAHSPFRAWKRVLLLAQRNTQETLDDLFDTFVSLAQDHVANLGSKKRKSQPVFDQVSIETGLSQKLNGFAAHCGFSPLVFRQPKRQSESQSGRKEEACCSHWSNLQADRHLGESSCPPSAVLLH